MKIIAVIFQYYFIRRYKNNLKLILFYLYKAILLLNPKIINPQNHTAHCDKYCKCQPKAMVIHELKYIPSRQIEAEDTAVVSLKFKNGALGIIEATTATRPNDLEGSISILGDGGTVEIGGFAVNEMKVWNFSNFTPGDEKVMEEYSVNPPNVYGFGHKAYYDYVVNCISNNGPHLVDGLIGRRSLELINSIYVSIESGKEVFLAPNIKQSKLGLK